MNDGFLASVGDPVPFGVNLPGSLVSVGDITSESTMGPYTAAAASRTFPWTGSTFRQFSNSLVFRAPCGLPDRVVSDGSFTNSFTNGREGRVAFSSYRNGLEYEMFFSRGALFIPCVSNATPQLLFSVPNVAGSITNGAGIGSNGSSLIYFYIANNWPIASISSDGFNCGSSSYVCGGASFGGSSDIFLGREAAAIWQCGKDSATPISQTFKGSDSRAGTDSNVAGGNITFGAGRGTGTAMGGKLALATSGVGSTGTAANALIERLTISSAFGLTNNTDTTIVSAVLGNSKLLSGVIEYSVEILDATAAQAASGTCAFAAAITSGGTATVTVVEDSKAAANTSGTHTVTWTIAEAAGTVSVKVNSNSSLTPTTQRILYTVHVGNGQGNAITFS